MKRVGAILTVAVLAAGGATSAKAAGLLIADGGNGGELAIKEQQVRVTLNNGVAVTTVTQVFQNLEDRQVEALYTFPVPKGASVSNFSMWINGKEMTGEVVEKKRAREIYDSYKQVRRDPGLLEQTNYRTFEMRVFPIAPRAEQRVQIAYYQELDFDHDWATYTFPLATNTRKNFRATTAGKFSMTVDAKSEVPLVAMESPSHAKQFAIAKHDEGYYQASLEVTGGDLQRDVVIAYQAKRPRTGIDVVTSRAGGEDGYFYLTVTAGDELKAAETGADYVFLLDVSGSMADDQKLRVSEKSIEAFIQSLGKDDRFEVVTFNVQAKTLFRELRAADDGAKGEAAAFLAKQEARGGTVLGPAMAAAYKYADAKRPLNVVLLSDGLTEQGETAGLIQAIKARPGTARVFCVGVGNDVNRGLLEQLSNDAGGLAAFLSNQDDFARQAAAFRRKLTHPAVSDLKIELAGADAYDVEPTKLGNLYHGQPVRVYGRYRTPGDVKVIASGTVNGQPFTREGTITLPKEDLTSPEIERMWALKKVDRLQKEGDAAGSRSAVVPEIVRLGEGYSIVTEYTSFLVLENDAEYQRWKIDRKNALRIARDRAAQQQVALKLEAMRDREATELGPVAAGRKATEPITQLTAANVPPAPSAPAAAPPEFRGRSFDFSPSNGGAGGGGGGGAIDPVSAGAVLAAGGGAWWLRRRKGRDAEGMTRGT
jgi:Ca-activated chloride channel family protein